MTPPRIARALLLAVAVLAPATAPAAEGRFHEQARSSLGVRLGAATALSSAAGETRTAPGGGGFVLYDIPGLLLDVSADIFAGESSRLLAAGFAAYYPFLEEETTPYVGGGVKLGWSRFGGDGAFGLIPHLSAGLLIGRSWSPQVRIDVAYFLATATERRDPGFESRRANGIIATFGIGF
jgi:hypothetical protein